MFEKDFRNKREKKICFDSDSLKNRIYAIAIILIMIGMSLFGLTSIFSYNIGLNQGYEQGRNYSSINIPNATLTISTEDEIFVNWYYNETFVNYTYPINSKIRCDLYRWQYIQSLLDMFESLANWYYNATGNSTEENYPSLTIFGELPNQVSNIALSFELFYDNSTHKFNPINSTIYGDLTGEYVITNSVEYRFTNESLSYIFGIFGIGSVNFHLGSGEFNNFLMEYLSIVLNSGLHENSTAGDWFSYWKNKFELSYSPLKLDLTNGKVAQIVFGDMNIYQNELELWNFDSLEKTLSYNKNRIQYLLNSSGDHIII